MSKIRWRVEKFGQGWIVREPLGSFTMAWTFPSWDQAMEHVKRRIKRPGNGE